MIRLAFTIPMAPLGKARPIVTRNGTFMPKDYEAWREVVRLRVRMAVPATIAPLLPLTSRLAWTATYCAPRGRIACDGDNADGALWDALQVPRKGGWGLFANDNQIKRWSGSIEAGPTAMHFQIEEIA